MAAQGMCTQILADPVIRAGHGHGSPGPVTNIAPCRREHLDRDRVGTLKHVRQVTDHASGSLGQSQPDRPIQLLDDLTERARNLNDRYLTDDACSGPRLPNGGHTSG